MLYISYQMMETHYMIFGTSIMLTSLAMTDFNIRKADRGGGIYFFLPRKIYQKGRFDPNHEMC